MPEFGSFIKQMHFATHCSGFWEHCREQNKGPALKKLLFSVGYRQPTESSPWEGKPNSVLLHPLLLLHPDLVPGTLGTAGPETPPRAQECRAGGWGWNRVG